jgi:hypothetical protein
MDVHPPQVVERFKKTTVGQVVENWVSATNA